MPSQWSITILDLGHGKIAFLPAVPGAQLNQPLGVSANDLVTWNNTTNSTLTLVSQTASVPYLTDPIPPGKVSDPIFKVTAPVITYACAKPTTPTHSIQIVPPPPPPPLVTS
jgi:hypothetical protein